MAKEYRIVQILPELETGGIESFVSSLNENLVQNDLKSYVISAGGKLANSIEKAGGTHIRLDVRSKNLLTFFKRKSLLENTLIHIRPDIINVHSRVPAWLTYFANYKLKIPIISTIHGFNHISFYSEIMIRANHVVCVSNALKHFILNNYKRQKPENVTTINCGVDEEIFSSKNIDHEDKDNLKKRYNLEDAFIVTTIGRFTKLKDFETFLYAISIAKKENPKIKGIIKGYAPKRKRKYYKRIVGMIKELGLNDTVSIITTSHSMHTIYALSDVVVSTSIKPESLGLTLIEAQLHNKPIIATKHGGPLDIIEEGINGFLFKPGDPHTLANLLINFEKFNFKNLREKAVAKFSSKQSTKAYIKLYKKFIDNSDQ
ncbi:MAG: glycosyl transferase [Euryarchaeota archaeon]|nr:glycosyl transferase [Euryarchaeota archaeon]|tara:strand:- start:3777 stop:4895 length:1119 start_codon:yes stop_codon:yes gene_type:complete